MRVLVTGGTGYVGAHLVKGLSDRGQEVVVACRSLEKAAPMVPWPGVELHQVGLHELPLAGVDALVHAAVVWPDESLDGELLDLRACFSVFTQAVKAKVGQLIYISSTAVHRPFAATQSVDSRLHTADIYGATKGSAELFLSAITSSSATNYQILRLGPVLGPPAWAGGPFKVDRRFASMMDAAREHSPMRISKGDARQFVAVQDVVSIVLECLAKNPVRSTYLCCDESPILWRDFAEKIIEHFGSRSPLEETPAGILPLFDTGEIEREFGLVLDARASLSAHVEALVDAYNQCH